MLGQAVAMCGASPTDAGPVRAWLCSLVVWGPGQEVRAGVAAWREWVECFGSIGRDHEGVLREFVSL